MKKLFAYKLSLLFFASFFTANVFGQGLPDPGGDPLDFVDSVSQNARVKEPDPALEKLRYDSSLKSHLYLPENALSNTNVDSLTTKKAKTTFLKRDGTITITEIAGYFEIKLPCEKLFL